MPCKLYEERQNASSGEGMDLFWETYELDLGKSKVKKDDITKKKGEYKSKSYKKDEEEDMNEQLCCLQILKFSAGKVNLGMGKLILLRFPKQLEGLDGCIMSPRKTRSIVEIDFSMLLYGVIKRYSCLW